MACFKDTTAYRNFEEEVRRNRRYVLTTSGNEFLSAVRITCRSRLVQMPLKRTLFRAQRGCLWEPDDHGGERAIPYDDQRMKPQCIGQPEGRVNSNGISCLYLSIGTTKEEGEHAAITEVRPWIKDYVTVAAFETVRPLQIVNCTPHDLDGLDALLGSGGPSTLEKYVWNEINSAFARPVSRFDGLLDYVPTQILAELFKDCGYDGIAYRSACSEVACSVALFDVSAASCGPSWVVRVNALKVEHEPVQ